MEFTRDGLTTMAAPLPTLACAKKTPAERRH
jgi:hypothetical protein